MTDFESDHAAGSMTVTASLWPCLVARPEDRPGWAPSAFAYGAHLIGRAPLPDAGIAVRRGKLLEPLAYQLLAEDHGIEVPEDRRQIRAAHDSLRALATLDGITAQMPHDVVELKVVDDYDFRRKWDPFPPTWYRLQCQAQLACAPSAERNLLCALVVGHRTKTLHLEVFEEPRRPAIIARLEDAAAEFLTTLERGDLPLPDDSQSSVDALSKVIELDPEAETMDLSASDEAVMRAERWAQASADRKAAEQIEKAQERWFRVRMGAATLAQIGSLAITAKEISRKGYEVKPTRFRQYTLKDQDNGN